jgi:hypothetical protein
MKGAALPENFYNAGLGLCERVLSRIPYAILKPFVYIRLCCWMYEECARNCGKSRPIVCGSRARMYEEGIVEDRGSVQGSWQSQSADEQ